MRWFGEKEHFAMRVGEFYEGNRNLRLVEIWVAEQHITCDDSWAYLPTFCGDLDYSISMLLQDQDQSLPWPDLSPAQTHKLLHEMDDGTAEKFWALNWGPTTDNVYALLFRQGQNDQRLSPIGSLKVLPSGAGSL